ncbi:MAG: cytidylate kinase [Candidatus Hepatoplasma scabrum]|nr:MAG: cytidylate kinase [Candidatus Hepatoplasma sp.]
MNFNNYNIAIDGYAATGKSTLALALSLDLKMKFLNTGKMYRLVALFSNRNNYDQESLKRNLRKLKFRYQNNKIDIKNFSYDPLELELQEISDLSSKLSQLQFVRDYLTKIQKKILRRKGFVVEGRDIGTVVIPDAKIKFFLTVSDEEGAKRRFLEIKNKFKNLKYDEILLKIKERNENDKNRKLAPLIPAKDAIKIDTTNKSYDQVFNLIKAKILEIDKNDESA